RGDRAGGREKQPADVGGALARQNHDSEEKHQAGRRQREGDERPERIVPLAEDIRHRPQIYAQGAPGTGTGGRGRAVSCMTMNSVMIDPIVMASPVNPLKKKAYEKSTR